MDASIHHRRLRDPHLTGRTLIRDLERPQGGPGEIGAFDRVRPGFAGAGCKRAARIVPRTGWSLVWNERTRTAETPRNRGLLRLGRELRARARHGEWSGGGGGSPERTRLCGPFPDIQGKYREIRGIRTVRSRRGPDLLRDSEELETSSLRNETGNSFGRTGNVMSGAGNRDSLPREIVPDERR